MAYMKLSVPKEVAFVSNTLEKSGFESYLVGGCVRDLLLGITPNDWDIATSATPEEIQKLFEHSFYENSFGTVGVVTESEDPTLKVVEVTPFRLEGKYSDGRRPDEVTFTTDVLEDLKRRDFTINAIAYSVSTDTILDPHEGEKDLDKKLIRTVGEAYDRFNEDYLRILRAIRLGAQLGFSIEEKTFVAGVSLVDKLSLISVERIRDEFSRLLMTKRPMEGIILASRMGALKHIAPEIEAGIKVEQNGDHIYDVWEHNLRALQHASDRDWPLHIRLGALLHDVSKPETRRWSDEKKDWTFYGHDVVGGKVVKKILTRLKYSNDIIDVVSKLVRYHLFFTDIDKITLSAVRRLVKNVGPENVWDLMKIRGCDRIGMGRPKEQPYRLRKYESMIEEAMRDPVSVGMLQIDGGRIMEVLQEKPGPKIGFILHALLEEVLDDPKKNTKEYLEEKTKELSKLSIEELRALGEEGKKKKQEEEEKELEAIRKKHFVK